MAGTETTRGPSASRWPACAAWRTGSYGSTPGARRPASCRWRPAWPPRFPIATPSSAATPSPRCARRWVPWPTRGGESVPDDPRQAMIPDDPLILPVLEDRAERHVHQLRREAIRTEQRQRRRPVDGLRHARGLLEVECAEAPGRRRCLFRDGDARLRYAAPHDPDDDLERRVVDPVVQASTLQRVAQIARAVRRQHHHGRVHGMTRPELRDRDGPFGEELEQERLELVVGPVDLVDQQHDRSGPRVLDG